MKGVSDVKGWCEIVEYYSITPSLIYILERMVFFMEKRFHTATITIYDRDASYQKVQELLHKHAQNISLRVGYPLEDEQVAIIFLILRMTTDQLGALSGQLGQLKSVSIKAN